MSVRIGEILVEKQLITGDQLARAVAEHQKSKEFLGQTLIRLGFISEEKLLKILGDQQGMTFLNLKDVKFDDEIIKKMPAKFAWHYKIMPITLQGNVLTVATSNPFDMWSVDDLETNLGYHVETVLALSSDIVDAIRKYYGVGAETVERILAETPQEEKIAEAVSKERIEDLEKSPEAASVVKLVNQILQQAIHDRATDIHFENFRGELLLRYRVDGILYDAQVSENMRYLYPAIISRIKVMANLDIVERRIPQDGRAKVKIADREYELRVSILPTLSGENVVIRILPMLMLFSMADLGIQAGELQILQRVLQKPHGIIFVTGPTGSGKTTTLYTCLSQLNTRERKIITIEDPVEYELRGVSQIQVNPKINLTFAGALRSILRHDPDIIMVGEVRDGETASITIQTALTGHLVFSTLHTNDAAGGATRLVDMGIDPFLITSSVEMFVAQRLVRKICAQCKEPSKIPLPTGPSPLAAGGTSGLRGEKSRLINLPKGVDVHKPVSRGKGCSACNNTGYKGRIGIYEFLVMNEQIRDMILRKEPADKVEAKAVEMGMKPMSQDGWEKVFAGVTTPEEVQRVTQVAE